MVKDLVGYHKNMVEAFRMEVSPEMYKENEEVRRLAKYINKFGRKVRRIEKLKEKLMV